MHLLSLYLCLFLGFLISSNAVPTSREGQKAKRARKSLVNRQDQIIDEEYHDYALSNPFTSDPQYFRNDFSTIKDGKPPPWIANRYNVYFIDSGEDYTGDCLGYDNLPLHPMIHAPGNFEVHIENNEMRYRLGKYPDMDGFERDKTNEKTKHRALQFISGRDGKTKGALLIPELALVLHHNRMSPDVVRERYAKGHLVSLVIDPHGYLYMIHPYVEDDA